MSPTLRPIAAAWARPLRHAILRPNQSLAELVYPGDDAGDTLHAGAFEGDALVGIASVYREAPPGERDERAWRLRGMGTLPSARRAGVGRALLRLCLEHVRGAGATRLWCNARTSARAFCAAQGLHARGDEFQMPDLGPHIVMVAELLSWELRAVTEADREFLRDLHRATLRDYVDQVWGWDDAQQREMFDARWDPAPRRIIRLDGRDVGTLTVETKRDEVFLADIGILPEFQSRGLGSSVIRRVLADADESGLPVRLQVLRPNPARRLYERLGFVVTEESPERYTMLRS